MADTLTGIVLTLHSHKNEDEWKNRDMAGLEEFRKKKLQTKWEGFSTWNTNGGFIDCFYHADIVIKPTKELVINDELSQSLQKNPFTKTEDIGEFYEKELREYLDREFEDHCTCDDYYPPVAEDFEIEYYVDKWCKENGFKMISCEGDGDDSGYEPDSVRKYLKY